MTFEGLLPFILLFIMWGASRIFLKMGKTNQKKQAPVDQKTGLFKILQQQLADLEEEDEEEEFDEYFQPPSAPMAAEEEKESLIDTAQDSLQQEPVMTGRETVFGSPSTGVAKPRPTILRKKSCRPVMNRHKLQNAVIWAEILAPPVALRDQ
ncbi:hypothetical protein ACFLYW_03105 [Thermodesulfobacteriota bacterium]